MARPSSLPRLHAPRAELFSALFGLALLSTLLVACERANESNAEALEPRRGSYSDPEADTSKRPVRDLDATSLRNMSDLLAGILPESVPGEEGITPIWREHAAFMDEAWSEIDRRLAEMRAWSEEEMATIKAPEAPLLYPFGGPDLINALQFFPEASSYLLVGLEAPGHLPLPEHFSGEALADDLERLRRPFQSMVSSGYFVRNEIDKDLSGGHFDGVLPILLIGLVRSGHVPVALDYVAIDPETVKIQPLPPSADDTSAVRIQFLPREAADILAADPEAEIETDRRTVYYFAQDLSNKGLFVDDPFTRLLERQPKLNVYMKSAEYLSHTDSFAKFRKLVLEKAWTILQDDSGLPVRTLTSDRFEVRFYGQYTRVLAAYSQWYQDDLAATYAKGKVEPLPFSLGYNSGTDGGCLILAERIVSEAETGEEMLGEGDS